MDTDNLNQSLGELKEEAVACAKCNELPNDVLILTCDHNLCLSCASKNLQNENIKASRNERSNQNSFQTVICELCHIATVLDPASATELLTMNHSKETDKEKDNVYNIEDQQQNDYPNHHQMHSQ